MKWYVAGPMAGYDDHNFPAFNELTANLRKAGHEVVNPAELDQEAYTEEELEAVCAHPLARRKFMQRDLPAMLDCDAVAVLPGWQNSVGACTEVMVATLMEMEVYRSGDTRLGYLDPVYIAGIVRQNIAQHRMGEPSLQSVEASWPG